MHVEAKNLYKSFGSFHAVRDVSFGLEKGKLVGLLGPSGGGKTTILRMLAGLETPDRGDIYFDGVRVNDVHPQKRKIGFVFQHYALFRHMTVYDNIAFGLKVQKQPKHKIAERVEELIHLTGLAGMEKRLPHQLSGGQRQRVAFARALAPYPQLLLLDEPFAAIDAKVRKELRTWLKEMIGKVGITTVFVTHDQEEAIEVADEMIIVNQGKIEQIGTPQEIYQHPKTPFVASFVGESSVLPDGRGLKGFDHVPQDVRLLVRPEFVELSTDAELTLPSASQTGRVRQTYFRGSHWLVEVDLEGKTVFAARPLEAKVVHPGDRIGVLIHRLYVLDGDNSIMVENRLKQDPMPVHI